MRGGGGVNKLIFGNFRVRYHSIFRFRPKTKICVNLLQQLTEISVVRFSVDQ
jgi:hypothetical protein